MKKQMLLLSTAFCVIMAISFYSYGVKTKGQETLWGAIAYSTSTGGYGFGYDHETQADAINVAVEECGERDCKAVVWFHNSCGAFAKGDGTAYGWGIDTDRDEAKSKALAACRKRGTGCTVVQSVCTSSRED